MMSEMPENGMARLERFGVNEPIYKVLHSNIHIIGSKHAPRIHHTWKYCLQNNQLPSRTKVELKNTPIISRGGNNSHVCIVTQKHFKPSCVDMVQHFECRNTISTREICSGPNQCNNNTWKIKKIMLQKYMCLAPTGNHNTTNNTHIEVNTTLFMAFSVTYTICKGPKLPYVKGSFGALLPNNY